MTHTSLFEQAPKPDSNRPLLGSHVSMSGKEMMLGSVKEALSYDANTFMLYTGAPQNTRRKALDELRIQEAWDLMRQNNMQQFIVHAPYIINLANTLKAETYQLAVDFLAQELERTQKMGSKILILHPGSHVGAGTEAGIQSIADGLNEVLSIDSPVFVALETMAGKGSEIGKTFEELAAIYEKCKYPERLRVCFDTCHVHDSGYDIIHDLDGVLDKFDRILGKSQIAVFHINDSKNERGAAKDRHADIGDGCIGFDPLYRLVHHPDYPGIPKILETPWYPDPQTPGKTLPPYKKEIAWLKTGN
ncbi:MAG: deoxyribonuclease IV [Lachnospiraceae bacterium]|nr:deoxyribonuclease IV [Lachnospiraceae bacterium]